MMDAPYEPEQQQNSPKQDDLLVPGVGTNLGLMSWTENRGDHYIYLGSLGSHCSPDIN